MKKLQTITPLIAVLLLAISPFAQTAVAQNTPAQTAQPAREVQLQLDAVQSGASILLSGNFHTVEGSFTLKHGAIEYDPATGKASGEIVFDATSGKTGSDGRDKKMHKDVLESARFPEISFRPDHAEGALATSGDSTLQVHGIFSIHGADHDLTLPVTVHIDGRTWTAKAVFQVPYVKWGMKNPSVLFLRVESVVEVQLHAAGAIQ